MRNKMRKWNRFSMVMSMAMITALSGYILVLGLYKLPIWIGIVGVAICSFFLLIMWVRTLGLDSMIRKKQFLKTGNIDDLEITDLLDEEMKDYVTNPTKLQELKDKIQSEKTQKERNTKIDDILG